MLCEQNISDIILHFYACKAGGSLALAEKELTCIDDSSDTTVCLKMLVKIAVIDYVAVRHQCEHTCLGLDWV